VQVLHATGAAHADSVRAELARTAPAAGGTRPDVPYVVVPYLDDMGAAYAAADFAVCRCGAMTCAELAAVGLPAVYVPFPIGNGEQRLNARPAVDAGAALLVDDADLTPAWITTTLVPLLADPLRVSSMAAQARQGGFPRAAQDLAELVERAAATGPRHRAGSGR
jgi:UDP-N-acetylglucosamine--N-acetylmuramyl-(pentapeptide) pyrophosphoryl-undecaprenol N-acetylglucosamine transferase